MEESDAAASQLSESISVLDLSSTYNITDSAWTEDPCAGAWEENASGALISSSSSSAPSTSASSQKYPGCRMNHSEHQERITVEDDENSPLLFPSNDTSSDADDGSFARTSLPGLEDPTDVNEAQLRASLDAFYELGSQAGDDPFSQLLSDKISELKQKNHLYALRSFQMAKIVLNQEGTNIFQTSTDNVFTSVKPAINIKPVAGLSNDVVRFIIDSHEQEKD